MRAIEKLDRLRSTMAVNVSISYLTMIATLTTRRQEMSAETNTSGVSVYPPTTRRIGILGKQGNKDHSSIYTLVTKAADFACCFVWV